MNMKRRDVLKMVGAAPLAWAAEPAKLRRVLYFTRSGGFEHSVVKRSGAELAHSERVLTELGKKFNFEVECTKDGSVFDRDLDRYDVIAFYTSGDLRLPTKDGAPPMTEAGKKKLLDAIAAGKGFAGFHAATDSFHSKGAPAENQTEVDPYIAMMGGEFIVHGPQQEASLIMTSKFPGAGTMGMGEGISFTDEWYTFKNFAKDLHVILVQETAMMKGDCYKRPDYPATWARMHGKGRVFYTSLGHREDVWTNPMFQSIAMGGLNWASGSVNFDIKPNLGDVAPEASKLKS
jgi:uncharacterized protein